jgi:hypothetical protein
MTPHTPFGAVAGSSSPRADADHGTNEAVAVVAASGSLDRTPRTPGADGANRENAGGIQ